MLSQSIILSSRVVTGLLERHDGTLLSKQQDVVRVVAITQGFDLVADLQKRYLHLDDSDELAEDRVLS